MSRKDDKSGTSPWGGRRDDGASRRPPREHAPRPPRDEAPSTGAAGPERPSPANAWRDARPGRMPPRQPRGPATSTDHRDRGDGTRPYAPRPPRGHGHGHEPRPPHAPRPRPPRDEFDDAAVPVRRERELRVFGVNACLAVFRHRRGGIRKIYLRRELLQRFGEVLSWCAEQRIGYRLVENEDLERLTQTQHHEGICFDTERPQPLSLETFLASQSGGGPSLVLLLDGVGNPHNLGALLRSAANFAVAGVLLPPGTELALSGAACRVAEGGAEVVPLVALGDALRAVTALQRAGYALLATVVDGGENLYATALPSRAVIVFGAEGGGISPAWRQLVPKGLTVPGSGAVESLNIATTVGVIAAEHWRRFRSGA